VKIIITPRRHGVPLKSGEKLPTPEENSARIAEGRRKMVESIHRNFPTVKILGIVGKGEVLAEFPDDDLELPARMRATLEIETGTVPGQGPPEPLWRSDIQPTFEAVAEAHHGKEYRPTVVGIVRDEDGRILLVQSRFNPDEWMFVQGGIEERESPLVALSRELREEVGIGPRRIRSRPPRFIGVADLDAEDGRTDKRGFLKGKRYFIFEVTYRGPEKLKLQDAELSASAWVSSTLGDPQMMALLSGVRSGKRGLMIGALIRILA